MLGEEKYKNIGLKLSNLSKLLKSEQIIILKNAPITKIPIANLEDFIHSVVENNANSVLMGDTYLYRGQSRSSWDLMPKIGRRPLTASFPKVEREMINEFRRLGRPYIENSISSNDWDLLAPAQHYGLETRLLDWSGNPLVALWFAFEEKIIDESQRAVWQIRLDEKDFADTSIETPFSQVTTKAFKPNHITKRITSQNGWFTAHKFITSSSKFIKLNKNASYSKKIIKFEIPDIDRPTILEGLDFLGINHLSLFPDLSGLSGYFNWKANK